MYLQYFFISLAWNLVFEAFIIMLTIIFGRHYLLSMSCYEKCQEMTMSDVLKKHHSIYSHMVSCLCEILFSEAIHCTYEIDVHANHLPLWEMPAWFSGKEMPYHLAVCLMLANACMISVVSIFLWVKCNLSQKPLDLFFPMFILSDIPFL